MREVYRTVDMLAVNLSLLEAKFGTKNLHDVIDTISSAYLCKDEFKSYLKNGNDCKAVCRGILKKSLAEYQLV